MLYIINCEFLKHFQCRVIAFSYVSKLSHKINVIIESFFRLISFIREFHVSSVHTARGICYK